MINDPEDLPFTINVAAITLTLLTDFEATIKRALKGVK